MHICSNRFLSFEILTSSPETNAVLKQFRINVEKSKYCVTSICKKLATISKFFNENSSLEKRVTGFWTCYDGLLRLCEYQHTWKKA